MNTPSTKKVLLIGWDAADWKIINPLMDAGFMPALNGFVNNGVMGNIATLDPPLSPMLWTSIATGKRAYKHGIKNFTEPDIDRKSIRPVHVTSRKVKAIWNILSQNNLKTHVVGWWPGHPAEPINGISVSNFYQRSFTDKNGKFNLVPGCIHPKEMEPVFSELFVEPSEITSAHILPFIPRAAEINQKEDNALEAFSKIICDASNIHAAATWILQNREWDFLAVYFDAIDHFCHRFMRYHPPRQDHIAEDQFEIYKNVVNSAYRFHDMMLERYIELAGPDATIILVSDHGFHSDHLRSRYLPKEPAAPAHEHRHFGIVAMKGNNIRKDERIYGSTLLDITPTILQLFGLPAGRDMEGKAIHDAFVTTPETTYIDSWETVEGNSGMHPSELRSDPVADRLALDQLVELGYMEPLVENNKEAVEACIDESQYNLARSYIDGGKHTEASIILKDLYHNKKQIVRYALKYFFCCSAMGAYPEAQEVLNVLKENESAAFINFHMLQGDLFLAQNFIGKALRQYNMALQKQPANHLLFFSMGNCCMKLNKIEKAKSYFLKALSIDENNVPYLHALANCYYSENSFNECIQLCMDSIGLLFHFPPAHRLLGMALYHSGKYRDAAKALELFLVMKPGHDEAKKTLQKIYDDHLIHSKPGKNQLAGQLHRNHDFPIETVNSYQEVEIKQEFSQQNTIPFSETDNSIIIVSGLPRSGTSLMMQMLQAGGAKIVTDEKRKADGSNIHGYFEFEPVKKIYADTSWLEMMKGKVVKIVAQHLFSLPDTYHYKIIFMQRDLTEVIHSQQVMLDSISDSKKINSPDLLMESYKSTLQKVQSLSKESNFDFLFMEHSGILGNPSENAEVIERFLGTKLDTGKMASVVDMNSYRSKLDQIIQSKPAAV